MSEIWLDVPEYVGLYKVSNYGQVRSFARFGTKDRILKPAFDSSKYHMVTLHKSNVRKHFKVHRLVLLAFIGEPPTPEHEANHKNGIRHDNRLTNLEWVTASENIRHAINVLNRGFAHGAEQGSAKLTDEQVGELLQLRANGDTQKQLGERFGISIAVVSKICTNELWKHVSREGLNIRIRENMSGENNPAAKLTQHQADEIRFLLKQGMKGVEIAKRYNISPYIVSRIKLNKTWRQDVRVAV